MKKLVLMPILLSVFTLFFASQASAAVPALDTVGRPASMQCTPADKVFGRIYHSDKIIFKILPGFLQPVNLADGSALNQLPRNTELDIKVFDDPRTVAGLKGKVLSFLGAQRNATNASRILIVDVEYATSPCV